MEETFSPAIVKVKDCDYKDENSISYSTSTFQFENQNFFVVSTSPLPEEFDPIEIINSGESCSHTVYVQTDEGLVYCSGAGYESGVLQLVLCVDKILDLGTTNPTNMDNVGATNLIERESRDSLNNESSNGFGVHVVDELNSETTLSILSDAQNKTEILANSVVNGIEENAEVTLNNKYGLKDDGPELSILSHEKYQNETMETHEIKRKREDSNINETKREKYQLNSRYNVLAVFR